MGKFVIRTTPTGVKFDLKAGNGEPISTSEVYKSEKTCRAGIASVKKNAPIAEIEDTTKEDFIKVKHPKFQVYLDKSEHYRFRLRATNGQIIASCGEPYNSLKACLNGIDSVKRNAPEATIERAED